MDICLIYIYLGILGKDIWYKIQVIHNAMFPIICFTIGWMSVV